MQMRNMIAVLVAAGAMAAAGQAQKAPATAPPSAPCTVAPQPAPCGKPPAAPANGDAFPFPGESAPAAGSSQPGTGSTTSGTGTERTDSAGGARQDRGGPFPFPGDKAAPAASPNADPDAGASSSSSSSSSSSTDDAVPVDPDATAPGLNDAGSEGNPAGTGRHKLHRVNPVGTKLQSTDEREAEDLDIAHFYTQTGNLQGAYLRAQDAAKIVPDDPAAHFALAETAMKLDKKDEAIAEYTACLKLDPEEKIAKTAKKQLERLKP